MWLPAAWVSAILLKYDKVIGRVACIAEFQERCMKRIRDNRL